LQFDPAARTFLDVFIANPSDCNQNVNDLHRPEGLVFGPDGNLYIASRYRDGTDTDKIVIFQGPAGAQPGAYLGNIPLDDIRFAEMSAQTLLFGPHGRLFVPISDINIAGDENTTVPGPDTGSVRRYDVSTKTFDVFVLPSAQGGPLGFPWYLTFGKTDPATLAYDESLDSCGVPAPTSMCVGDCGGTGTVAVNDLITLADIALGNAQPSACPHGIPSGSQVNVALIIRAANNSLDGCPAGATPTPTPTPTVTFTTTATPTPTGTATSTPKGATKACPDPNFPVDCLDGTCCPAGRVCILFGGCGKPGGF
jgi:hypothetical protein